MASWTAPYRVGTAVDSMIWQGMEEIPGDDASNDLFGHFMDFGDGIAAATSGEAHGGNSMASCLPVPFFMNQQAMGTASSVVSSADEFDFMSSSTHLGLAISASQEVEPPELFFGGGARPTADGSYQFNHIGRGSISDSELQRLEEISIRSPHKNLSISHPPSPTPPTTTKKPNRFVEAISSTIRKATTLRKTKKALPVERSVSPTLDRPSMAIKPQSGRMGSISQANVSTVSHESHSPDTTYPQTAQFIQGYYEDPFSELQQSQHPDSDPRYFSQSSIDNSAMHSPNLGIKSEEYPYQCTSAVSSSSALGADVASQLPPPDAWQHQMHPSSGSEQWSASDYTGSHGTEWWDMNMFSDPKNASVNQAMHSQHAELPYEYAPMPDASAAGLMMQLPQAPPGQSAGGNDLALTAQTYLPPPPPIPTTERATRPPRAPSSGARHRNISTSPMRKTRGPSASPTPGQPNQMRNQSRHSSTGSVSSVRSVSGRTAGSVPNTPSGVRKRRSREAGAAGGGLAGEENIGFVNFTPSDGNVLMTGVAPSGSSKTKARREKEAQERRRRLSEAAMKAVAAAGGDVDKLIQEGFVF